MKSYNSSIVNTTDLLLRLAPRRRQYAARLLELIVFQGGKLQLRSPDLIMAMASDDLHHLGLAEQRFISGELLIVKRLGGVE